jgi:4-amino-4-deoxy-L-arabinose transferase-like glycosyltransferase
MLPGISLEMWGRLLSVFMAIITAYIIFLIGKKYLGSIGGVLSAFFYLFIPFNVYFTRVILPEPMAVLFSVWALWLFIRYVEKEKYYYLGLAAFVFSIGLLIKPYVVFYGIPMFLLAYQKWGIKGVFTRRELVVAGIISAIPLILWRMWIGQYPEGIPFWKWAFNGDAIRFRPAFWYWLFGERLGKLILGVWGMFPFIAGLISFKKSRALVHYLGFGMLFYIGVVATANVRHDYYQTLIIPSIALILAQGTLVLWNVSGFDKYITRIVTVFSIVLALIIGAFQVKEFYRINRPEIIIAGEAVDRISPPDVLVIAPYNGDTAFLYHTKRRGWPVVDRPIEELIEKGAEYFVSVDLNHPQTIQYMKDYDVIEKTGEYVIIMLK